MTERITSPCEPALGSRRVRHAIRARSHQVRMPFAPALLGPMPLPRPWPRTYGARARSPPMTGSPFQRCAPRAAMRGAHRSRRGGSPAGISPSTPSLGCRAAYRASYEPSASTSRPPGHRPRLGGPATPTSPGERRQQELPIDGPETETAPPTPPALAASSQPPPPAISRKNRR
jgi:hypothetical protein